MTIPHDTIKGISIGSYGTCILIPSLNVALDIGRCPEPAVAMDTVLITHGHIDHLGGIGHHCARRELMRLNPPTYVMKESLVDAFETLMAAFRLCDTSKLPYNLVVLGDGLERPLDRSHTIRTFPTDHIVPSQGYTIWETRKKLRPDLVGRPGAEIAKLAHAGEQVSVETTHPELAYTGDTRISVVKHREVTTARILIMEVTFLDDRVSPEKAHRTHHIHLDDVINLADMFDNEHIFLVHPSMRYKAADVERILADRLPDSLRDRVTPLPGLGGPQTT